MRSRIFWLFWFAAFCLAIALPAGAGAEDVTATSTLTQDSTTVGEPVELQLKITGTQRAGRLQKGLDGLEITYEGASTQVQFTNGNLSMSVVETYNVKPLRAGKFVLPGEVIDVGGSKVATNSVTLNVGAANADATAQGATQLAFSELVLPKQSAYVGEMMPLELRIYIDARVRASFQDPPEITADGFSMQKMTQPVQSQVRRNGLPYNLLVFKTAIAPVKAGKLEIGPATLDFQAEIPQRRPAIAHFADPFDNMMMNPFGQYSPPQQVTIKCEGATVEAKPLPAGAPKSFTGAVGAFTMITDSTPMNVNVGDPVTLTAIVSGWGNLDAVRPPIVSQDDGWRLYPPSSTVKAEDDVGIRGRKTFAFQMIPQDKRTALPGVQFSYFDPVGDRYVTLSGQKLAVNVKGQAAVVAAASPAEETAVATPTPGPAQGIQYIRTDSTGWGKSFEPLYTSRVFWGGQIAPLMALAGLVAIRRQRDLARTAKAARLAALQREKQGLMRTLRSGDATYADFVDAAARYVQLGTALATDGNAALVDAEEACASRPVTETTAAAIRRIFGDREAIHYAGASEGLVKVQQKKRDEVLEALQEFDHALV